MTSQYQMYSSPLGRLLLAGDSQALTGLWFAEEVDADVIAAVSAEAVTTADLPVFAQTRVWLDTYFAGQMPDFLPPLRAEGTVFQQKVWQILQQIPYGATTSYGAIARQLAAECPGGRMSAQAVGGAVGRNPISILIPCHRVIGADGSLTGYAAGVAKKKALLELESAIFRTD